MPSPEFIDLVDYTLGEILSSMRPEDREFAQSAEYLVDYRAMPHHKSMTGTPQDYQLLGMYEWEPKPKITVFEESLTHMSYMFGGIYNAVKEALNHEIWQHLFDLDHTKETEELGYIPAFAVDESGLELHQWLLGDRR